MVVVTCRMVVASRMVVVACRLVVAAYQMVVVACRLVVVACRMVVVACRLVVVGAESCLHHQLVVMETGRGDLHPSMELENAWKKVVDVETSLGMPGDKNDLHEHMNDDRRRRVRKFRT
jgi:hypothetical protein